MANVPNKFKSIQFNLLNFIFIWWLGPPFWSGPEARTSIAFWTNLGLFSNNHDRKELQRSSTSLENLKKILKKHHMDKIVLPLPSNKIIVDFRLDKHSILSYIDIDYRLPTCIWYAVSCEFISQGQNFQLTEVISQPNL